MLATAQNTLLSISRCAAVRPASTSTVWLNGRTAHYVVNTGTGIRVTRGRLNTYIWTAREHSI